LGRSRTAHAFTLGLATVRYTFQVAELQWAFTQTVTHLPEWLVGASMWGTHWLY